MIKLENTEVVGWEAAIRGMRNPMNSWEKSDSGFCDVIGDKFGDVIKPENYRLGPNDHDLMVRLRNAGTDHRKFMRMITVYVDITSPLYWWKEFDTYKVGTVANSCSTMHKIHEKEFTLEDFSCEHLSHTSLEACIGSSYGLLKHTIDMLNKLRNLYLETINGRGSGKTEYKSELAKMYWWQMIQLLPSSYNQKRTVMLNYEVLANIYKSRKVHKLDEWRDLCKWIETLPYSELITGKENKNDT